MRAPAAPFPFSAVVGQDEVRLALLVASVDRAIGGVLLRGDKGTAKTTLARGLAALLPEGAPFVELPIGASEDRVTGSIDLRAALGGGVTRFEPGLLHAADGGVLYVDEVNLLPDHLVDVLLDVSATGVNRVEREGISHVHPSRFILLGSMNPEEGELRPQLLDRFGLSVIVTTPSGAPIRAEAVRRRLAYEADPGGFAARFAAEEAELRRQIATCVRAAVPDELLVKISELCEALGAEGLRGDIVCARAASALAGLEGRSVTAESDVERVAAMVLGHRRRRSPFEEPGIADAELDDALRSVFGGGAGPRSSTGPEQPGTDPSGSPSGAPSGSDSSGDGLRGAGPAEEVGSPEEALRGTEGPVSAGERSRDTEGPASAGERSRDTQGPASAGERSQSLGQGTPDVNALGRELLAGRRREGSTRLAAGEPAGRSGSRLGRRGRIIGARVAESPPGEVALVATVSAARRRQRRQDGDPGDLEVLAEDIREPVAEEKVGRLLVLAVDTSGSMGARQRAEAARRTVLAVLLDAYQRRDRVGVVTFGGQGAAVALAPTGSIEVARARLADMPTGGRTPLAEGILLAHDLATRSRRVPAGHPLLAVVSDGHATEGPDGRDPFEAALEAAGQVRLRGTPAVVFDAETGPRRLGLARELAEAMGARHLPIDALGPEALSS